MRFTESARVNGMSFWSVLLAERLFYRPAVVTSDGVFRPL